MEFHLTESNPAYDQIREQGWAYIEKSRLTGTYGAPYVDEGFKSENEHSDTRVITWDSE